MAPLSRRAAALLFLALAAMLAAPAAAQRGDRYANAGQGTQRANDRCTFVYKVRAAALGLAQPKPRP